MLWEPDRFAMWAADPYYCQLSQADRIRLHGMGARWSDLDFRPRKLQKIAPGSAQEGHESK